MMIYILSVFNKLVSYAQCSMLHAQCPMLNASCSMPNAQCLMLNANMNRHDVCHTHSSPDIRLALTRVFTTPPTPNAGTILAIRARLLFNQSTLTFLHLSTHGVSP